MRNAASENPAEVRKAAERTAADGGRETGQALRDGLMFTDHEVSFTPTDDSAVTMELLEQLIPILKEKLSSIGRP